MAQNTRDIILKEIRLLFSKQGYHATSMEEIARAVGIRKPSLYHHFSAKHEIFFTLLHEILESFQKEYARDPSEKPQETLTLVLFNTMRLGVKEGGFLQEVKMLDLPEHDDRGWKLKDFQKQMDQTVMDFLEKAHVKEPRLSSELIMDAIQGYMKRKMGGRGKTSLKDFSSFLADRILP